MPGGLVGVRIIARRLILIRTGMSGPDDSAERITVRATELRRLGRKLDDMGAELSSLVVGRFSGHGVHFGFHRGLPARFHCGLPVRGEGRGRRAGRGPGRAGVVPSRAARWRVSGPSRIPAVHPVAGVDGWCGDRARRRGGQTRRASSGADPSHSRNGPSRSGTASSAKRSPADASTSYAENAPAPAAVVAVIVISPERR